MCGICVLFLRSHSKVTIIEEKCEKYATLVRRRGPDCHSYCHIYTTAGALYFSGHVLHLRGELTPQPLRADNGDVLLWNGEIFDGVEVQEGENDTRILLTHLQKCQSEKDIVHLVSKICGPWALVYWQASTECLWFGRDIFGRRSLLWHLPEKEMDTLSVSSVKLQDVESEEIPAIGLFCLKVKERKNSDKENHSDKLELHLYPWKNIKNPHTMVSLKDMRSETLKNIFFSRCLGYLNFIPHFDCEIPKEITMTNRELCTEDGSTMEMDDVSPENYLERLLKTDKFFETLTEQLKAILLKSVVTRVLKQPGYEKTTIPSANNDSDDSVKHEHCLPGISELHINDRENLPEQLPRTSAKVAILFSGGIDSTVLAALADKCVPENEEIDLMNVAFQQQRQQLNTKHRKQNSAENMIDDPYSVPDRQTGLQALTELNPSRKWNFIKVNVTLDELQNVRSAHARHLVYPLCTVLDDSIGCAIWFAARGRGIMTDKNSGKTVLCQSNAKVILCGMGADEQLAGYARHRVKFKENGWEGLLDEIDLELNRISARNLGRDDRIISDHGKESRFPFLDEDVVEFLCGIPLHYKANLKLPRGLGEKLLLRLCAWKLGLKQTAVLPKRAIQFGSKIAKMENNKEKATDKCSRLTQ